MRAHHKLQRFVDTLKLDQTAVQHLLEKHPDLEGDDTEAGAALAEFRMPGQSYMTPLCGEQHGAGLDGAGGAARCCYWTSPQTT
jgi:hypothetical protein